MVEAFQGVENVGALQGVVEHLAELLARHEDVRVQHRVPVDLAHELFEEPEVGDGRPILLLAHPAHVFWGVRD